MMQKARETAAQIARAREVEIVLPAVLVAGVQLDEMPEERRLEITDQMLLECLRCGHRWRPAIFLHKGRLSGRWWSCPLGCHGGAIKAGHTLARALFIVPGASAEVDHVHALADDLEENLGQFELNLDEVPVELLTLLQGECPVSLDPEKWGAMDLKDRLIYIIVGPMREDADYVAALIRKWKEDRDAS